MTICRNKCLRSKQLEGKLKSLPLPPAVCLVIMDVPPSQKPAPRPGAARTCGLTVV